MGLGEGQRARNAFQAWRFKTQSFVYGKEYHTYNFVHDSQKSL